VLERNVSAATVRVYKFADLQHRTVLAGLIASGCRRSPPRTRCC